MAVALAPSQPPVPIPHQVVCSSRFSLLCGKLLLETSWRLALLHCCFIVVAMVTTLSKNVNCLWFLASIDVVMVALLISPCIPLNVLVW